MPTLTEGNESRDTHLGAVDIVNSKTGQHYDLSDACVEKGPQVAYNAAAYEATAKAVKDFLVATFRLPAP